MKIIALALLLTACATAPMPESEPYTAEQTDPSKMTAEKVSKIMHLAIGIDPHRFPRTGEVLTLTTKWALDPSRVVVWQMSTDLAAAIVARMIERIPNDPELRDDPATKEIVLAIMLAAGAEPDRTNPPSTVDLERERRDEAKHSGNIEPRPHFTRKD